MGEKLYRPILDDGEELLHSKDNPERVRGLTRDENNNPGINEWEEVDILVEPPYTDANKNEYQFTIDISS